MTKETMTVHKALTELKVIDSRIEGAINTVNYCVAIKHNANKIDGISIDEYGKNIQSAYDKAIDLISRRNAIKKAVVLSNASTKIRIGDEEYTIAEAIDMKNHRTEYIATLKNKLSMDLRAAMVTVKKENGDKLAERADKFIESIYGQKESKLNSDEVQKAREEFIKTNEFEIYDTLDVAKLIETLEDQITTFMTEVDSALSVSNAVTIIEIEY